VTSSFATTAASSPHRLACVACGLPMPGSGSPLALPLPVIDTMTVQISSPPPPRLLTPTS
jgi:hypothetical protein